MTKSNKNEALQRYRNDSMFYALTETLAKLIAEGAVSMEELHAAVDLANERAKEFRHV